MFSRDREAEDKLNRSTMFRRKSRKVKFTQADNHGDRRAESALSALRTSRAQQARVLDNKKDADDLSSMSSSLAGSADTDHIETTSFLSSSATDESTLSPGKSTYIISNTRTPSLKTETPPPARTRYTIKARDDPLTSAAPEADRPQSVQSKPNFKQIRSMFESVNSVQITASRTSSISQVAPHSTTGTKFDRLMSLEAADKIPTGPDRADCGSPGPSTDRQSRRRSRTITLNSEVVKPPTNPRNEQSLPRSLSKARHGPPPASFPHNFYARGYTDGQAGPANPARLAPSPNLRTPSISPHAIIRPSLVLSTTSSPTPTDSRGRPSFHTAIHHFTMCSHTSPPASRPLDRDAQPRVDTKYVPPPDRPDRTRSIIPGSCINCDTAERRREEQHVISTCTDELIELTHQLYEMVEELEVVDSKYCDEDTRKQTLTQFYASRSALQLPIDDEPSSQPSELQSIVGPEIDAAYIDSLSRQVSEVESKIAKLRDQQGTLVKNVWKGFTKRWGASTLTIARGGYHPNPHAYLTLEDEEALDHQREQHLTEVLALSPTTELATTSPQSDGKSENEDNDTDFFVEHARELVRTGSVSARQSRRGRRTS